MEGGWNGEWGSRVAGVGWSRGVAGGLGGRGGENNLECNLISLFSYRKSFSSFLRYLFFFEKMFTGQFDQPNIGKSKNIFEKMFSSIPNTQLCLLFFPSLVI